MFVVMAEHVYSCVQIIFRENVAPEKRRRRRSACCFSFFVLSAFGTHAMVILLSGAFGCFVVDVLYQFSEPSDRPGSCSNPSCMLHESFCFGIVVKMEIVTVLPSHVLFVDHYFGFFCGIGPSMDQENGQKFRTFARKDRFCLFLPL